MHNERKLCQTNGYSTNMLVACNTNIDRSHTEYRQIICHIAFVFKIVWSTSPVYNARWTFDVKSWFDTSFDTSFDTCELSIRTRKDRIDEANHFLNGLLFDFFACSLISTEQIEEMIHRKFIQNNSAFHYLPTSIRSWIDMDVYKKSNL